MRQLADGLWHWTVRHPEWHPRTAFGAEVGCYAAHHRGATVLIDPLLDDGVDLDPIIAGEVVVAITIPYHVRSAAAAVQRWGGVVLGHPDLQRRLPPGTPFTTDDDRVVLHRVKRLKEQPVELPDLRAIAFGDRVVGVEGGLRVWIQRELTEQRRAWYRREAVPALEPLLERGAERVLVTHGPPVLSDGRQALQDALDAEPWYHRPS